MLAWKVFDKIFQFKSDYWYVILSKFFKIVGVRERESCEGSANHNCESYDGYANKGTLADP